MTTTSTQESAVRFHTRIAPEYDELMARHPGNAWVREAFRQKVRQTAPSGCVLLDFGCGTGVDALWYAQHGYQVLAYDNAPGMIEQLQRRCAREIEERRVIPLCANYDTFQERFRGEVRPQAIVANFAVLNHIHDLRPLFRAFGSHISAPGWVIVSVLNPFYWKDLVHPIWWRPCLRSIKTRCVACVGPEVTHYRHYPANIVHAARPDFMKVEQVGLATFLRFETGDHAWGRPRSLAERLDAFFGSAYPLRSLGKFIFLVFRRAAQRDTVS